MSPETSSAMTLVENERRRDRFIRRVSIIAWSVSLFVVVLVAVMVIAQASQFISGARAGEVPWSMLIGSMMPLVDVLWKLSLLIATLSTVAIFVRLRTASLAEIQLRLASLEEMIAAGSNKPQQDGR